MKFSVYAVCAAALLTAPSAMAAVSYIRGADAEKGEFEIEYQAVGSFDDEREKDNKRSHKIEAYYGFSDSVQLGGGFKFGRSAGDNTDLETVFVEGLYQFFEEDEVGFNMAVLGEYVHATESGKADKLEGKLLYDNEWGDGFETRANLILEHEIGNDRNGDTEIASRLGTVYEINDYFAPGIEWQAEYGAIDDIGSFDDEQKHYVGPVTYGELYEFGEDGGEIEYELGYYFGVTDAAEDGVLRVLIEYEIEF